MKPRIMYIEDKSDSLNGIARIGWVAFNRTGKTISYQGKQYRRVKGYKYNHFQLGTGARFWISG